MKLVADKKRRGRTHSGACRSAPAAPPSDLCSQRPCIFFLPRSERTDVPYCLPCATWEERSPHRIAATPTPQISVSQGARTPTSCAQKRAQFWARQASPKMVSPGAPLYCLVLGKASVRRQAGSPGEPKNGLGNLTADACFLEPRVSKFLDPYSGISENVSAVFASSISYF